MLWVFCLYLLSSITCAVASSTQKQCPTFTFQMRKAQGGSSSTGAVSCAAQPSHGQENSRETAQAPTSGYTEAQPTGKRTRSCLTSHPLGAASSTPQELGKDMDSVLQGGLAAPQQHLQGLRMKAPLRRGLWRGLCQPTGATHSSRLTKGRTR